MPSKGNPVERVRMRSEFWNEINAAIALRNTFSRAEPWTFSAFVRQACADKLRKMERSRRRRKRCRPGVCSRCGQTLPLAETGAMA